MASRVPFELIYLIIEAGAPQDPRTIVPPSSPITKTLLSWRLVCRATRRLSWRLLLRHCAFIDSAEKLRLLLLVTAFVGAPLGLTQMYMSPFPHRSYDTIPPPLDQPSTVADLRSLFEMCAPTLRRLIVDMPLRSLYPERDRNGVRVSLRAAFSSLYNMEELVSLRDELYLDVSQTGREDLVWATRMPKLRRLALYNVNMHRGSRFLENVANHPSLDRVILSRPDGRYYGYLPRLTGSTGAVDMPSLWLELSSNSPDRTRGLTLTVVNIPDMILRILGPVTQSRRNDAKGRPLRILFCKVPFTGRPRRRGDIELVQQFIKTHALDGTLFEEGLGKDNTPTSTTRRKTTVAPLPLYDYSVQSIHNGMATGGRGFAHIVHN